ncbi:hypothetical protein ACHAQJ_008638 [Trichoderma viride]
MSSYSNRAAYNGDNKGKVLQSTTYSIDRFLGRNGHVDEQRPPLALAQMRDDTKAVADAKSCMLAKLDAFDAQLNRARK